MRMRPRFYFSFRSPFSWIAARLLEENLSCDRLEAIEYLPFWEPDRETSARLKQLGGECLYVQMSREKHLYILQDIKRMTKSLGYAHVWPLDVEPWWELPNLAYLAAHRLGKGREFRRAVYRSRWQDGRDIHKHDTLRTLAAEVGLDPDVIAAAPEDREIRETAAGTLLQAHREGVFGVPFFVNGFNKFWGIDRLSAFLASLEGKEYRYFGGVQ